MLIALSLFLGAFSSTRFFHCFWRTLPSWDSSKMINSPGWKHKFNQTSMLIVFLQALRQDHSPTRLNIRGTRNSVVYFTNGVRCSPTKGFTRWLHTALETQTAGSSHQGGSSAPLWPPLSRPYSAPIPSPSKAQRKKDATSPTSWHRSLPRGS